MRLRRELAVTTNGYRRMTCTEDECAHLYTIARVTIKWMRTTTVETHLIISPCPLVVFLRHRDSGFSVHVPDNTES